MEKFVGRTEHVERLASWLDVPHWFENERRLHVKAISGPGGVGKTTFFNHVLKSSEVELAGAKYLQLRIDGNSNRTSLDIFAWVDQLVRSASQELKRRSMAGFRRTHEMLLYQKELSDRLVHDLREKNESDTTVQMAKALFGLARLGKKVYDLDFGELTKKDATEDLQRAIQILEQRAVPKLWWRMYDYVRRDMRRFRREKFAVLAEAFVEDCERMLAPEDGS